MFQFLKPVKTLASYLMELLQVPDKSVHKKLLPSDLGTQVDDFFTRLHAIYDSDNSAEAPEDFMVVCVEHRKFRDRVYQHEFVVTHVQARNPKTSYYLVIDRTRSAVSSRDNDDYMPTEPPHISASEYLAFEHAENGTTLRSKPKNSSPNAKSKNALNFTDSKEIIKSSNPTNKALDCMKKYYGVTAIPPSELLYSHTLKKPISVFALARIANIVHEEELSYRWYNCQCYWFAVSIMGVILYGDDTEIIDAPEPGEPDLPPDVAESSGGPKKKNAATTIPRQWRIPEAYPDKAGTVMGFIPLVKLSKCNIVELHEKYKRAKNEWKAQVAARRQKKQEAEVRAELERQERQKVEAQLAAAEDRRAQAEARAADLERQLEAFKRAHTQPLMTGT